MYGISRQVSGESVDNPIYSETYSLKPKYCKHLIKKNM